MENRRLSIPIRSMAVRRYFLQEGHCHSVGFHYLLVGFRYPLEGNCRLEDLRFLR